MRNAELWQPTKYVSREGRLRGTTDRAELSIASRLIADIVAGNYERILPIHARGRLLDMGCGKAPLYGAYREHVDQVTCIDWANSPHAGNHVDVECDLGKRLPFADESFDTILLSDVLEHLPDPHACWREMARLLRPGGKVLMNVPFYYPIHESPHDFYRYTQFALRRLAESACFEVLELSAVGGAPEILADLLGKLLLLSRFGAAPAAAVQAVAGAFVRTGLGSKLSRSTQDRFPFGYVMVAAKRDAGVGLASTVLP